MTIIYMVAALYMSRNNLAPREFFFIEWALFSAADALWALWLKWR